MSKLIKVMMNSCRSNSYLMIGLCLGLSLSLFLSPVEISDNYDNNQPIDDPSWASSAPQEPRDEYIPKINLEGKPKRAQKIPKAIVRPRYYSTELGIREKLFIGVSTSREFLHNRGVAFNKTVAHLVDKIRYFITIPEGTKPNVSLPGIVGFTDTRKLLKPFHIIKYITDNYLEEYDYYFIINDSSYVNARKLISMINELSVSKDVYLGSPFEVDRNFCSFDAGILISNSIIRKLKVNLDWCVKNTFSDLDEINFGRCVKHSTTLDCSSAIEGVEFLSTKFSNNEEISENSVSVILIENSYDIHIHFALNRIREINKIINDIERDYGINMKESVGSSNDSVLFKKTWPTGNKGPSKSSGRFDLIRWNYFNETHVFMETDFENARGFIGSSRIEIDEVFGAVMEKIHRDYGDKYKFEKLINGWRRFDAARGIDYILDISVVDQLGRKFIKRLEICKTLGKAEILSVPYVTENSRINLVLIVESWRIDETIEFIDQYAAVCMEKKDKTSLMLVLLYDPDSPSKGTLDTYYSIKNKARNYTDKYKKNQSKITWLSIRILVNTADVYTNPMIKIGIADLVAKKFTPESLILFTQTKISLKPDYLNRVRMNTIMEFQIFSPIPFTEYHPDIAYSEDNQKLPEIDINRNHGSYDNFNYDSISFYVKDYQDLRKNSERDIPIVRNDKDILTILKLSKNNIVESIFELFVVYSELHALRAVEPALKIRYSEINCRNSKVFNELATINCERRKYFRLGHRGQLAKLILDYRNSS